MDESMVYSKNPRTDQCVDLNTTQPVIDLLLVLILVTMVEEKKSYDQPRFVRSFGRARAHLAGQGSRRKFGESNRGDCWPLLVDGVKSTAGDFCRGKVGVSFVRFREETVLCCTYRFWETRRATASTVSSSWNASWKEATEFRPPICLNVFSCNMTALYIDVYQ